MEKIKQQQQQHRSCFMGSLQPNGTESRLLQDEAGRGDCPDISRLTSFTGSPGRRVLAERSDGTRGTSMTAKRVTTSVFAAPCLAATYIDIPVPVYVPRYVEVPVPVAKIDPQITQQLHHQHQLQRRSAHEQQQECMQQFQHSRMTHSRPPAQVQLIQQTVERNDRFIC